MMSTEPTKSESSGKSALFVRKSIVVGAPPERAFRVFTEQMGSWWPLATHHIGKVDAKDAIVEPRVGGRFFERGVDGSECMWGHVLAWDPPRRVILSWELNAEWKYDPSIKAEVEVTFVAEGSGTRVELEHRGFESYGDKAIEIRDAVDSPGGWTDILSGYGKRVVAAGVDAS